MSNEVMVIFGVVFIFAMTTLGAGLVFLIKNGIHTRKVNVIVLGFASGIMISASIWSLLLPAVDYANNLYGGGLEFLVLSFIIGGLFISLLDVFIRYKQKGKKLNKNITLNHNINNANHDKKTAKNTLKSNKTFKLFIAVTAHNIPEGLAVGIAFGSAIALESSGAFISALMLAIGIGVQNFPEGMAVALPIKNQTGNNKLSFLMGMLSGAVEPVMAVIGILLASSLPYLMPWLLAFSAGAMIFVVVEELIPDKDFAKHKNLGAWGVMMGFIIMMVLDIVLA